MSACMAVAERAQKNQAFCAPRCPQCSGIMKSDVSCAAQHEGWGRSWNTCFYKCADCSLALGSHEPCLVCPGCRVFRHNKCRAAARAELAAQSAKKWEATLGPRPRRWTPPHARVAQQTPRLTVSPSRKKLGSRRAAGGASATAMSRANLRESPATAVADGGAAMVGAATQRQECAAASSPPKAAVPPAAPAGARQPQVVFDPCPSCGGRGRHAESKGLLQLSKLCPDCAGSGCRTGLWQLCNEHGCRGRSGSVALKEISSEDGWVEVAGGVDGGEWLVVDSPTFASSR